MTVKQLSKYRKDRAGAVGPAVSRFAPRDARTGQFLLPGRNVVVSRTASKVSLVPKRESVKAGKLSDKFTIEIRGTKTPNAKHELINALVVTIADGVAGISNETARHTLARMRAESPETVLAQFLSPTPEAQSVHSAEIPAANKSALERAFKRAERSKAEILSQSDMLTGEQLAEKIGVARATVDNRRQENKLLALDFGTKRGFRYPEWQSDLIQDAERRAYFERTLELLGVRSAWEKYRFFTQASPSLGGETPLNALRSRDAAPVFRVAEVWASGEQGGA